MACSILTSLNIPHLFQALVQIRVKTRFHAVGQLNVLAVPRLVQVLRPRGLTHFFIQRALHRMRCDC